MYQWIATQFEPITFVAVCIALTVIGVKVRETSKWVAQRNTILTFVLALVLLTDGLFSFHFDAGEFLASEWLRIVLLILAVHGLIAFILRCFEEILRGIVHPTQTFVRSREAKKLQAVRDAEREREQERRVRELEARRPERERAAREQSEQKRQQGDQTRLSQSRREDARKQTLLMYHRCAKDISESLPWERFSDYMKQFMNDSVPPEIVEARGKEMQEMILSFFEPDPVPENSGFASLAEITARFQAMRVELENLPCDENELAAQLAYLSMEEARAIRKFKSQ